MKIERPIFLGGFARGGSNIFLNLVLSHSDVCCPAHEFQEVFMGRTEIDSLWRRRLKKYLVAVPMVLLARQNFLRMNSCEARKQFSPLCRFLVDRMMYLGKLSPRARHESLNLYRSESREYTREEIKRSRTIVKILNGQVLLTENLATMYPNAVFFGLVRNGLALCQGYVRRGLLSADDFAHLYKKISEKMLEYSDRMESFHIYRFDDVLADPIGTMQSVYDQAGLDISGAPAIRLQAKSTLTKDGRIEQRGAYDRQLLWYSHEAAASHFKPDIDSIQACQLADRDRDAFLNIAGETMERLGYSTDRTSSSAS